MDANGASLIKHTIHIYNYTLLALGSKLRELKNTSWLTRCVVLPTTLFRLRLRFQVLATSHFWRKVISSFRHRYAPQFPASQRSLPIVAFRQTLLSIILAEWIEFCQLICQKLRKSVRYVYLFYSPNCRDSRTGSAECWLRNCSWNISPPSYFSLANQQYFSCVIFIVFIVFIRFRWISLFSYFSLAIIFLPRVVFFD